MSILAGLHLYPKTPKDLTVTTRLGGTVSLIGLIVMGFLFVTELRAYVVPSLETTIELDDNAEKKLLISFNISLPHVPCHVASVDVKDVLGTRIANVTQNAFKWCSLLQSALDPRTMRSARLAARCPCGHWPLRRPTHPLARPGCPLSLRVAPPMLARSGGGGGAMAHARALAGVSIAAFGRPGTSSMCMGGSVRWWVARCRSPPRGSG